MAARYCCTAQSRSYTPDQLPVRAVELTALDGAVTTEPVEPGSRYTSARTEELQEIGQLFNDVNLLSSTVGLVRRKSRDLQHAYAEKHPSVGDLFPKIRNKLARKSRSKSMAIANMFDLNQLQRAKSELRNTLTSSGGPAAGGYDDDAPELRDVEAAMTPEVAPSRGRGKQRSIDAQVMLSSSGSNDFHNCRSQLSSSLSPPRKSAESHRIRRSWSDSSLASPSNSRLPHIRLPSFEAATSSKSWRKAVMHSLQISPSIPNFSEADTTSPGNSQVKEDTFTTHTLEPVQNVSSRPSEDVSHTGFYKNPLDRPWAFSHSAKPSTASAKPVPGLLQPGKRARQSSNVSVHLQNMRISHHLRSASSLTATPFASVATTATPSAMPTRPQTPEHDISISSSLPQTTIIPNPASAEHVQTQVHRKPSPIQYAQSAAAIQCKQTPVQRKPTPIQRAMSQMSQMSRNGTVPLPARLARQQRQTSDSGFSTEDMPEEWGKVIKGDDAASSMYSTALESPGITPRPSASHLPRPSIATVHEHHPERTVVLEMSDENAPLTATARQSSSSDRSPAAANNPMPENPSTSNLSENSKSSKVSRFKEDFDKSMTKKSTKRNSIVNLFTRSKAKRRSNNLDSFDGSSDDFPTEPKRLQRATRLADKQDAASGLLAKAITANHDEKSALFLDPSKVTPRDSLFRQRSSSFCKPRGLSASSDDLGQRPSIAPLQVPPKPSHTRSTSDTLLKPEFSMPSFDEGLPIANPSRRSVSAGRLRPDFSTSIFSSTLSPGQPSPTCLKPRLSIALDPMEITPTGSNEASNESRSPSFQLNDFPALMESLPPTPSTFDASRPTTGYISDSGAMDIDDPNLNLGAWSRYPSHTRDKRNGSASTVDKVKTRDFAYDINPLNILEEEDSSEESPHGKHKKKSKKKKKRTGLPKSKSMMIGKEYIKNYVRLIRSPSVEWLQHGKGHRSSISAGGNVEHPELELLPPVFASRPIMEDQEGEASASPIKARKGDIELQEIARSGRDHGPSIAVSSGQSQYDGSTEVDPTVAERKRRAASSPDLSREMAGSRVSDALTWSRHYESCVYLPRASQSLDRLHCHPLDSNEDANTGDSSGGSEIPLLIDSMLARSRASSVNYQPMIVNGTVPLRKKSKSHHRSHTSVGSVSSIRASSMDLLKTLAEAENREHMKCLEILTRQRSAASSRHISQTVEVVEVVEKDDEEEVEMTTIVTTYDMETVTPVVVEAAV